MTIGTLYLILARFAFVLSSYALHIALAYLIVDVTDYGRLGVIFSMMSLTRIMLTSGLPQVCSREIASSERNPGDIFRKALTLQIGLSFILCVIYIGGIPLWTYILGDPKLTHFILLSGFIIPFTAVYQIWGAWLNGRCRFKDYSKMLTMYSVGRIFFALLFVLLGMGIAGVLWGFLIAIVFCLIIFYPRLKLPVKKEMINISPLIRASLPFLISSLGIIGLVNMDLIILKHFFPQDTIVGYYSGAVNIGKLPYFILIAYATTILPIMSKAISAGDMKKAQHFVKKEITSLIVILILSSTLVVASAEQILCFLYPNDFAAAADSLKILYCASGCIALLQTMISLFGAIDRMNLATAIVLACLPLQIFLGCLWAPRWGGAGMALANMCSVGTGLFFLLFLFYRFFGQYIYIWTLISCIPAGLGTYWLSAKSITLPLWMLPIKLIAGIIVFLTIASMFDGRFRASIMLIAQRIRKII